MSFRCQFSGERADNRESPVRIVVETRSKTYVNVFKNSDNKREEVVSEGSEIVKEILVRARHVDEVKKRYRLV